MRRFALGVALVIVASGLGLGAITFGQPDGSRHPFVGTVVLKTASGYFSCSGTLLSPGVMLTAGHCTSEGHVTNERTWVKFTQSISLAGATNYPSLDAFLDDPVNGWITGQAIPHPQYNDFADFPEIYDVGVVLLDSPVLMSNYGSLPPLGLLSTIRRAADNQFTAVGYGLQGYNPAFFSDIWQRFQGQVRLIEMRSAWNGTSTAKFTNNPGIGGGSCYGDSGGPIFYGTTNMVVAVISWGQTPCIGVDYNFRLDTPVAQNFVLSFF